MAGLLSTDVVSLTAKMGQYRIEWTILDRPEDFYERVILVGVSAQDLAHLEQIILANPRSRFRLYVNQTPATDLNEKLILMNLDDATALKEAFLDAYGAVSPRWTSYPAFAP